MPRVLILCLTPIDFHSLGTYSNSLLVCGRKRGNKFADTAWGSLVSRVGEVHNQVDSSDIELVDCIVQDERGSVESEVVDNVCWHIFVVGQLLAERDGICKLESNGESIEGYVLRTGRSEQKLQTGWLNVRNDLFRFQGFRQIVEHLSSKEYI